MNLTSADIAGDREVIDRADAMREAVAAAADESESTRRLPRDVLDRLHEARLFRLLLPRSTDGIETDPVTFFHAIETIARADASTAWCLSQAGGCAMSAAYLDLPVAQEVFADPRAVLAKIREEADEIEAALDRNDRQEIAEETGDLMFALVNLARHVDADPETALRATNAKFERRFAYIEKALAAKGRSLDDATLEEMDALWNEAKSATRPADNASR